MSLSNSPRTVGKYWCLLLVLSIVGFNCHPVPENDNAGFFSTSTPLAGQTNDLQSVDSDLYPEVMTEFLRLTTNVPTTTSTKTSVIASSTPTTTTIPARSTSIVSSTITETITETTPITKAFELVTATFVPSSVTTVTSRLVPTTTERPVKSNPVGAAQSTPSPVITSTPSKSVVSNETRPWSSPVPAVSKQPTIAAGPEPSVTSRPSKNQSQKIPSAASINQLASQTTGTPAATTTEQSTTTTFRPQSTAIQVSKPVGSNPIQQQQMAVQAGPAAAQSHNNNNNNPTIQTAGSNGPRQHSQQQMNSVSQKPVSSPTLTKQPIQTAIQQPSMGNMAGFQQRNPFLLPPPLVNRQPMAPFANQIFTNTNSGPKPKVFIRGGNGTPYELLPPSTWQNLVPFIPSNGLHMLPHSAVKTPSA